MKKMMTATIVAILGGTGIVPTAHADVCVEDVKCVQRYPWNGLVDIEYTIACDDPNAEIYVNPVGFNGDTGLTVFPTHFTGDGATNTVKAGKHTMVWDAKADMGLFASKNFQIKMYAGKTLAPYVVVDLSSGPDGDHFPIRYSLTGPDLSDDKCRTTELWLRLIPPGTFMMGSPADELGRHDDEDLHKVTLTEPFYIGVFEVTHEQWYRVMNNWRGWGDSFRCYPVHDARFSNWKGSEGIRGYLKDYSPSSGTVCNDCFLGKLRAKTDLNGFDLPTEAQWEYACRSGTTTALNNGTDLTGTMGCSHLNELGRYYANGTQGVENFEREDNHSTSKAGSYKPNAYGLYDMHGNVYEWCRDAWCEHLGTSPCQDPLNETDNNQVVIRGGFWAISANGCRSAFRKGLSQDAACGFRISCPGNLQK